MPRLVRLRSMLFVMLLAIPLTLAAACGDDDDPDEGADGDATATAAATATAGSDGADTSDAVKIGALLPLTGSLSSYGETSEAALALAVEAIEADGGAVDLIIEDTGTDPEKVLEALEALHDEDVRLVVGPYASSTLTAVKDYADQNDIVLISPLSTSKTLAVADDNVFRFTPDDDKEGVAVAALAWEDGVRTIIPISRDDPGNLGLERGTRTAFEALGGTMLQAIVYPADASEEADFADYAQQLVDALASVEAAEGEVAIYLTAFGEVTGLFAATTAHEELKGVTWYGSDSVALSEDLVNDDTAAAFAVEVGYPNPILGLAEEDESSWAPVLEQLQEDLGRRADAFALAAYDALMVGYQALSAAGADADVAALKTEFVSLANDYQGLTGSTRLNDAGDRDVGIYDFWAVCQDGDGYTWIRAVSYAPGADQEITRPEQCS